MHHAFTDTVTFKVRDGLCPCELTALFNDLERIKAITDIVTTAQDGRYNVLMRNPPEDSSWIGHILAVRDQVEQVSITPASFHELTARLQAGTPAP